MTMQPQIPQTAPAFSAHALERVRQRGITPYLIDVMLKFGNVQIRKGAYVYSMNKPARRRMARAMGADYARIQNKLGFYVVESFDGVIVTVAYRNQRLKR